MNPWILAALAAALLALRLLKPGILIWMAAWLAAGYVFLKTGIRPPLPSSIIAMYLSILTAALLLYLTADTGRMAEAARSGKRFLTERRFAPWLYGMLALVPLVAGAQAWREATRAVEAPASGRTIHPAPPSSIKFKGKTMDLVRGTNPYRELESKDPAAFDAHVANGRRVYYQNCVFCHGDNMEGDGNFAHGFDPLPANFQNPGTIAMLQETYLFWRIAKGGPGLPEESTPWSSSMPAWEKFLGEEEIWDVILFLYKFTGQKPRAAEHHE